MAEIDPAALADALRLAHLEREAEVRARWDRSLPFAELFSDRWERARRLGFGEEASVYDSALVLGDVEVGAHSWIGPQTLLDGSGGLLRIGSWCSISAGVHLYTHDTVRRAVSMGAAAREVGPVSIGDGCHLGALSVVVRGVTIGDRCVVGANSFVNADVPDRAIVVGSPARPVGMVVGDGEEVELRIGPDAVAALGARGPV